MHAPSGSAGYVRRDPFPEATVTAADDITDEEIARIRERHCGSKVAMTMRAARDVASRTGMHPYRCVFANEHEVPELQYHVGHQISMYRMKQLARFLRSRHNKRGCHER